MRLSRRDALVGVVLGPALLVNPGDALALKTKAAATPEERFVRAARDAPLLCRARVRKRWVSIRKCFW